MLKNIFAFINTSRLKNKKENKPILSATQAFQCLMTATADAIDAREEGIQSGIIPPSMSDEEAIPYLFALYIFYDYEKEYSPIMASNFLRIYCPDEFFPIFNNYYKRLSDANEIDISEIDFQSDFITPFIDISVFATRCIELGYKRHWNPFKEPYRTQWDFCFAAVRFAKVCDEG